MQIAIALYPGFTALDAVGPYQVFANVPDSDVVLVAEERGRLDDENGMLHFEIEHRLEDVPQPDMLVMPGGLISRRIAAAGGPLVDWVRAAHEHTTWTTSVCTGSLILGAAGVLDGKKATSHWFAAHRLAGFGATYTEQRVVFDGKVVTAAGVSSGIDLGLAMVGRIWGDEVAQSVQLGIEYDPQPPYDAGAPSKAPAPIRDLVSAIMTQAEADLAGR